MKNLNKILLKLKELKIKSTKKINNKFEYLNFVIKKNFVWEKFKKFYFFHLNETKKNSLKFKNFLMKKIINKKNIFNRNFILKNYFNKWKIFIIFFNSYYKKLICFKLKKIDVLIKMKIKFYKKIFIFLLKIIFNNKKQIFNEKIKNLIKIHSKKKILIKKFYLNILIIFVIKIFK